MWIVSKVHNLFHTTYLRVWGSQIQSPGICFEEEYPWSHQKTNEEQRRFGMQLANMPPKAHDMRTWSRIISKNNTSPQGYPLLDKPLVSLEVVLSVGLTFSHHCPVLMLPSCATINVLLPTSDVGIISLLHSDALLLEGIGIREWQKDHSCLYLG